MLTKSQKKKELEARLEKKVLEVSGDMWILLWIGLLLAFWAMYKHSYGWGLLSAFCFYGCLNASNALDTISSGQEVVGDDGGCGE